MMGKGSNYKGPLGLAPKRSSKGEKSLLWFLEQLNLNSILRRVVSHQQKFFT